MVLNASKMQVVVVASLAKQLLGKRDKGRATPVTKTPTGFETKWRRPYLVAPAEIHSKHSLMEMDFAHSGILDL